MSISVYILDDEQNGIDVLEWHLKNIPDIMVCATQTDALKALDEINQLKPQVLILDIQMPGKSGFDVVKELQRPIPHIIFVTAYDQFAIKAIRFSAVDYLVKPVDATELKEAISLSKQRIQQQQESVQIENLLYNIKMMRTQRPKLAVPAHDGIEYIPIQEIIHCMASDNYTHLFLTDKRKITASKTLKDFESMLEDYQFVRIHQSHLVNLEHIRKYIKTDGGSVMMENGDILSISRAKKDTFLQKMGLL